MDESTEQQPLPSEERRKRNRDIAKGINTAMGNPVAQKPGAREFEEFSDGVTNFRLSIALRQDSPHVEDLEVVPDSISHPVFVVRINRSGTGLRAYATPFGTITEYAILQGKLIHVDASYLFTPSGRGIRILEVAPEITENMNLEQYWVNTITRAEEDFQFLSRRDDIALQETQQLPIEENEYMLIESALARIQNGDLQSIRSDPQKP